MSKWRHSMLCTVCGKPKDFTHKTREKCSRIAQERHKNDKRPKPVKINKNRRDYLEKLHSDLHYNKGLLE